MNTTTTTTPVSSLMALRLAATAECDVRTAARALKEGVHTIRTSFIRERLARAMGTLGIDTGPPSESTSEAGDTAPRQQAEGLAR